MNIAISGGGPAGLTCAIRLVNDDGLMKKIDKIAIYEKRNRYSRDQFIISGGSKGEILMNYPNDLVRELRNNINCYMDDPIYDMYGFCILSDKIKRSHGYNYSFTINKFEKILLKYIKRNYKNTIQIIHKEFDKKYMKDYDIIIGADG